MLIGIIRPSHWLSVMLKVRQKADAPRHALVLRLALAVEQDRAGIARADQLAAQRFQKMLVVGRQLLAAHFAALGR